MVKVNKEDMVDKMIKLPKHLNRRLVMFCAEHDVKQWEVLGVALSHYLDRAAAKQSPAPTPSVHSPEPSPEPPHHRQSILSRGPIDEEWHEEFHEEEWTPSDDCQQP